MEHKLNQYQNMIEALERNSIEIESPATSLAYANGPFFLWPMLELQDLTGYFRRSNELWEEHLIDSNRRIDMALDKPDSLEKAYRYTTHTDELYMPPLIWQSTTIMLYSIVEANHFKLCKILESQSDSPVKFKHLYENNVVKKCKLYLKLCIGLDYNKINKEWGAITELVAVRNALVHQSTDQEKIDKVKRIYQKYSNDGSNDITAKFVEKMLDEMSSYFIGLESALEAHLDRLAKEDGPR